MQSNTQRAERARRFVAATWALALAAGIAEAAPSEGRLVTIQKATGKPLATATLWRGAGPAGVSPVVGGGWAYYVENGEMLCGLNLISGKVFWRTRLEAPAKFATLAGRNMVLVCDENRLWAYAALTGRPLWQTDLSTAGEEWRLHEKLQFAADARYLVVCGGPQLLCLDATTGEPVWGNQNAGLAERPMPVLTEKNLFVRAAGDSVRWIAFQLTDGMLAEETEPPAAARPTTNDQRPTTRGQGSPVRSRSGLAVAPDGRSLTATVGSRRWSYHAPQPFAIDRVLGDTGNVVLLQLVTGEPQSAAR